MDVIGVQYGHEFKYQEIAAGGAGIDACGKALPEESMEKCLDCDSVLLGAVGIPNGIRSIPKIVPRLPFWASAAVWGFTRICVPRNSSPQLAEASPLKPSIVAQGIDFLVVRELIGGVYFGNRYTREIGGQLVATDEMTYGELEVERIARVAFDTARKRRSKVTSIDKANVLDSSRLWRKSLRTGGQGLSRCGI